MQDISGFPLPDLALVAEHSDSVQLGRLLQLVLGCAVKCEHKQGKGLAKLHIIPMMLWMYSNNYCTVMSVHFRLHPEHHDFGGVCSARRYDSHTGSESLLKSNMYTSSTLGQTQGSSVTTAPSRITAPSNKSSVKSKIIKRLRNFFFS